MERRRTAVRRMTSPPAVARPPVPWSWVALGGVVVAGWVALASAGGIGQPGSLWAISAGGAAAGAGAAVLAGASPPARRWGLAAALAGMLLLPPVLAFAASGGDARPLIALLPLVTGLGVVAGGRGRAARLRAVAVGGIGTTLLGGCVFASGGQFELAARTTVFGATLVAAGVLLAMAGAGGSVGVPALKPLLAVGLVAGVVGATAAPGLWVALLVGGAAVGVAEIRPALAVALLAIAVAGLPGGQPAAALVGAGAVLAVALERDWAVVAALPGAIAVVEVLLLPSEAGPRVAVAGAAGLTALLLARDLFGGRESSANAAEGSRLASPIDLASLPGVGPRRAERHRLPALVLAVWLLVAPATWSWAGDAGIGHYDNGAGRAVAVAALMLVALACADHWRRSRRPTMAT